MSEPRTFAPFEVVHAAQREACEAVWAHDPRAACVIGAARYYNRFRLNASLLIRGGGPVLYAAVAAQIPWRAFRLFRQWRLRPPEGDRAPVRAR